MIQFREQYLKLLDSQKNDKLSIKYKICLSSDLKAKFFEYEMMNFSYRQHEPCE
jgi:hypothetical protein